MIFAQLTEYPSTKDMLAVLEKEFTDIEWGDQGTEDMPDAYFWIQEGKLKVAVDNLGSHAFQVKCPQADAPLLKKVIDVLSRAFSIEVFDSPGLEPHE